MMLVVRVPVILLGIAGQGGLAADGAKMQPPPSAWVQVGFSTQPPPRCVALPSYEIPTPVVIEPKEAIEFSQSPWVYSVAFAPSGESFYVAIDGKSVDLWRAVVSAWKEIIGALVVVAALISAWMALRAYSRAQTPGVPYCRRCNYDVQSQAPRSVLRRCDRQRPAVGTRCPECGVDLHRCRPRRGRSVLRRIAIPLTLGVLLPIGYAAMLLTALPRVGSASTWFTVFSETVDRWAERNNAERLLNHNIEVTRVVEIRCEDRSIVRTLALRRGRPFGNMLVSPDGRFLAMPEGDDDLVCLNTRNGRVAHSLTGVDMHGFFDEPTLHRYDAEGNIYFTNIDAPARTSELVRWNPRRRTRETIIQEPLYFARANRAARRYSVTQTGNGIVYLSASSFLQANYEHDYQLRVYDAEGEVVQEMSLPNSWDIKTAPPVVDGRTQAAFVVGRVDGLLEADLTSGESHAESLYGESERSSRTTAVGLGGSLLFAGMNESILVREPASSQWLARLRTRGYSERSLYPSPDGRWLAAVGFRTTAPDWPPVRGIVLYDLKPLQDYLAEHPVAGSAAPSTSPSP